MKKLLKQLRGRKYICFMDFEGTQFSHEMIAIGAVFATINPKTGRIRKSKAPFHILVRAKNKIGKYVVDLTGITEEDLREKGVTFTTAMMELKKYCGMNFKKCLFVTFGNHDMRIISQTITYNLSFPKEICSQIQKNYMDYSAFISEFIKDENGNPLSLVHYCEMFNVPEAGVAHDPSVDAVNLMNLYDAFLNNKEIALNQYKLVLQRTNSHFPPPVAKTITALAAGKDISAQEFENLLKEYLD